MVCLMRKRHLYREDEISVVTVKQGEGKVLAFIVCSGLTVVTTISSIISLALDSYINKVIILCTINLLSITILTVRLQHGIVMFGYFTIEIATLMH